MNVFVTVEAGSKTEPRQSIRQGEVWGQLGLMQKVPEEKSGEAGKESSRKVRQRASWGRRSSKNLPSSEEGNRKATPLPFTWPVAQG